MRAACFRKGVCWANEVIRNRSQVLAENLTKWGHPDVVVTNNDPADFSALPSFFDVILTDVPCSGEGMFRKDPVAVEEWSPENVEICWQRQRRIIDIWPCLKPGGILTYSTCTYNSKEDEENVCWIQQEFGGSFCRWRCGTRNITGNLLDGEMNLREVCLSVIFFLIRQKAKILSGGTSANRIRKMNRQPIHSQKQSRPRKKIRKAERLLLPFPKNTWGWH